MGAIMNRLCRLENATAPAGRERAAVETILAARRRRGKASARIGADNELTGTSTDSRRCVNLGCGNLVFALVSTHLKTRPFSVQRKVFGSRRNICL